VAGRGNRNERHPPPGRPGVRVVAEFGLLVPAAGLAGPLAVAADLAAAALLAGLGGGPADGVAIAAAVVGAGGGSKALEGVEHAGRARRNLSQTSADGDGTVGRIRHMVRSGGMVLCPWKRVQDGRGATQGASRRLRCRYIQRRRG